jgi:hypothetical protein
MKSLEDMAIALIVAEANKGSGKDGIQFEVNWKMNRCSSTDCKIVSGGEKVEHKWTAKLLGFTLSTLLRTFPLHSVHQSISRLKSCKFWKKKYIIPIAQENIHSTMRPLTQENR